jgi:hypothetical protein
MDGSVIETLGFGFSAWTRLDEKELPSFSCLCGSVSDAVPNCCLFKVETTIEPRTVQLLRRVLELMVEAFEPSFGILTSGSLLKLRDAQGMEDAESIVTYRAQLGFKHREAEG